jgi:hypothetical protein
LAGGQSLANPRPGSFTVYIPGNVGPIGHIGQAGSGDQSGVRCCYRAKHKLVSLDADRMVKYLSANNLAILCF